MNTDTNTDTVVIFLSENGYKLSSYYGKILSDTTYATLDEAKTACENAGYNYTIA